jgi:hypothetical protein
MLTFLVYIDKVLRMHFKSKAYSFWKFLLLSTIISIPYNVNAQLISENEVDLRPMLPLPQNQGESGACVFFAVTAAMETFPGVPKLSESSLLINYISNKISVNNFKNSESNNVKQQLFQGTTLSSIANYLEHYSLEPLDENRSFEFDYRLIKNYLNAKEGKNANIYDLRKKTKNVESQYFQNRYIPKNINLYKKEQITKEFLQEKLRNKTPVVISIKVRNYDYKHEWSDSSLQNNDNNMRVTEWEIAAQDGKIGFSSFLNNSKFNYEKNNHAVLIVGYKKIRINDSDTEAQTVYIVRNSWGTQWGNFGYGYITEKHLLEYVSTALTIENYRTNRVFENPKIEKENYEIKTHFYKTKNNTGELVLSLITKNNYALTPDAFSVYINNHEYTTEIRTQEDLNHDDNKIIIDSIEIDRHNNIPVFFNWNHYPEEFKIKIRKIADSKKPLDKKTKSRWHVVSVSKRQCARRLKKMMQYNHKNQNESEIDQISHGNNLIIKLKFKNKELLFNHKLDEALFWSFYEDNL